MRLAQAALLSLAAVALLLAALFALPMGGRPVSAPQGGLRTALLLPPVAVTSNGGTGGAPTLALPSVATGAHDSVYVGVLLGNGANVVSAPTDSASDHYTLAQGFVAQSLNLSLYYTDNVAATGALTVTLHASGSSELDGWVAVINGSDPLGSLGAVGNPVANGSGSGNPTTAPLTTTHAESLVVSNGAGVRPSGGGFPTSGAGVTLIQTGAGAVGFGSSNLVEGGNETAATVGYYPSSWVTGFHSQLLFSVEVLAEPTPLTCGSPSASHNPADAGAPIGFTPSVSGGTTPYAYVWALNGSGTFATTATPTHTFAHAATYTVYLNVTDSSTPTNQTCAVTLSLVVHAALGLRTAASPPSPHAPPVTVTLYANATGGTSPFSFAYYLNNSFVAWDNSSSPDVTFAVGSLPHGGVYKLGVKLVDTTNETVAWANLSYAVQLPAPPVLFIWGPLALYIAFGLLLFGVVGVIVGGFVVDRRRRSGRADPPSKPIKSRAERRRYDRIVRGVERSNREGRSHANPYAVAQTDLNRRRGPFYKAGSLPKRP